jgi:hypothetical protein
MAADLGKMVPKQRDRSASGEVETSQAEVDLKALEGFLVGNQDLERLEALLDHFNIFEAP